MATIQPGRLHDVTNAADHITLVQDNFEVLSEELLKITPTYLNGAPNAVIGPPTSGERVLGELWKDSLGAWWRCTAAGTPGTWQQVQPAAVAVDPASGTVPTGYLVLNVTTGTVKRHAGGSVWETGQHYEEANGTLRFESRELYQSIPVVILNPGIEEAGRSFQIHLDHASNGGIGNPGQTTVTIQDPAPIIYQQPAPAGQSVSLGAMLRIQTKAKGALMQCQHRAEDEDFADLPAATSQVLERPATIEMSGEYRFIVSNTTGDSVVSQIVTVEVDPTFTKITGQPIVEDVSASSGLLSLAGSTFGPA